jgi:hypothetical protein
MSISAETYIVISLMFAVFAAVAAVGTSVVLGAGFERLRAGFDHIRRQSGFFADAIYKLDQRTQKLDEETAKLKSGMGSVHDRMDRVEKQTTFVVEAVNSLEHRILNGTPVAEEKQAPQIRMHAVSEPTMPQPVQEPVWADAPAVKEEIPGMAAAMFDDYADREPEQAEDLETGMPVMGGERGKGEGSGNLTTLLARYFTGEQSGNGIVYH